MNIDLTNPVATATKSPAPNAFGWNNTDVVVTFSGTDTVTGIDSCTLPATVSAEGAKQSRSGTCTDLAGRGSNLLLNHRRLGGLGGYGLLPALGRALLASAVMAGVILALRQVLPGDVVFLAAALPLGLIVYFLVSRLLGSEEIPTLIRLLRQRRGNAGEL